VRRRALVLAALALAVVPAPALADGDPASDVLIQQDFFLPYSVVTSQGAATAVRDVTTSAAKAGWPVKVAIIAGPDDLGSASSLANDPQGYANFLSAEIATPSRHQRLLIVTPVGFGGENLGDNVNRALGGLTPPSHPDGDQLAQLAVTAIARLATADGHPVRAPQITNGGAAGRPYRSGVTLHSGSRATLPAGARSSGGGGGGTALAIAGPIALVILAAAAITVRRRRRVPPA